MTSMSADDIVSLVRTKIDEIGPNDSEMMSVDKDDSDFDSIIKAVIPDAYRLVILGADQNLLEGTDDADKEGTDGLTIDTDCVGTKKVPDDFLRFVSVRLSSWKCAVHSLISEDSEEYRMQSDKWTCGNADNPVAALVWRNGKRYVEMYKAESVDDTLTHFVYVQQPEEGATTFNVPSALREAIVWYTAGLALVAVRDSHSDKCLEVAKGLMGYSGE
jgi:hypothetical protein